MKKVFLLSMICLMALPMYKMHAQDVEQPRVILGYLKVFPNEIGEFSVEPTSVINNINRQAMYGYNTWRIPTNEELSLLRSNNLIGSGNYMTKESKKGIVLLVTDEKDYKTLKAQGWVNLGLPSGTLWKEKNEVGLYCFSEAIIKYGKNLPSFEQARELVEVCNWYRTSSGFKVTGPNGNSIYISALGNQGCDGKVWNDCERHCYTFFWTNASYSNGNATVLEFWSGKEERNDKKGGLNAAKQCEAGGVILVSERK